MMTLRALVCCVTLSACLVTPVMHFGEGKTAKQAQHDTMSELGPARLATEEHWRGEITDRKVRVWADNQYRSQNIHWQQTFEESLELTNAVITALYGVRLVPEYMVWDRDVPGATLTDGINALQERDPGDNVFAVIGLTSSLPLVSATFDELGLAMIGGRHLMMRGYADLEERKLYANAFPDLRPEERELALEHLRHHKTAVVLLHELGHVLGVVHDSETTSIMNAMYSNHATSFPEAARDLMLRSVDERLGRPSTGHVMVVASPVIGTSPVKASTQAPVPQEPKRVAPAVHHEPVAIRVTKKREMIVNGKTLTPDALKAMLEAVFAEDPTTKIIIREDRNVPTGVVGDLIDRLHEIGFEKAEFAWSGK